MIPKVIHFCWLSSDPYPPLILQCMDSWREVLPDYEFRLWDTKRFDVNSTRWTREAYEQKKYAFAADYIRLYALYTEGGIYLDSDVLMYKSFNELLHLPYFIGEDHVHYFETAIIGAEKGTAWLKDIMEFYERTSFNEVANCINRFAMPNVCQKCLTYKYKFRLVTSSQQYTINENTINIFRGDFFNSRNFVTYIRTSNSYCSHCFAGSWMPGRKNPFWKQVLPLPILNLLHWIYYHLYNKHNIKCFQIKYE